MEINENNLGIFYVSKLLALAPFSIHKNAKGVLEIRRSIMFSVYTLSLCLIMVFLTYRGLLFDANSQIPVRMKSATSKVVTALDVSVVVLATTAGVFCGLLGYNSTRELNSRLRKIDDSLHSCANLKRDRLRSILILVLPFICISILLALDVWTWMRFATNVQKGGEDAELNVQWYIPFYSLYFILTCLHIFFANTALGLGCRYRRLNAMLASTFLGDKKKDAATKSKITAVKTIEPSMTFHASLAQLAADNNTTTFSDSGTKNKVTLMKILSENHGSLGKCVAIVSSSYGIAVLFILVSCLLHLVATAYFLFLQLLMTEKDDGYIWLQVLWIIFHSCRLLLVVEPCHWATKQSKKTIEIICAIERKVNDPILNEEIKKFWQHLLVIDSHFSASGLCRVNRNILTSFSSAIATYLVILIQFQKTNG